MNNETREKHCVKKGQRFVPRDPAVRDRFQGCLLGGAVGDALGGAVEFLDREYIVKKYGEPGIRDYAECYGGKGLITDECRFYCERYPGGWQKVPKDRNDMVFEVDVKSVTFADGTTIKSSIFTPEDAEKLLEARNEAR